MLVTYFAKICSFLLTSKFFGKKKIFCAKNLLKKTRRLVNGPPGIYLIL